MDPSNDSLSDGVHAARDGTATSNATETFTAADYRDYIAAFNRGDFAKFSRYYTSDVEFHGRNGLLRGPEAITDFYRQVRARLRERIEIRQLVVGRGELLADLVTHLEAFEDWPELPSGPIAKGETRRSENFIWYELRDRQFWRVRSAHFRRGPQTDTPPLPASGGTRLSTEQFAHYIDAFNRDDYAEFANYYAPDVTLVIAGKHTLNGRQAILDFYKTVKAQTRRTIEVKRVISAPHTLAAELQSEFIALQDLPHFTAGPMRKGDRTFINTFVLYDLADGRFVRIRSAELRKLHRP
jgi:ketosteroid isomerase-like protein